MASLDELNKQRPDPEVEEEAIKNVPVDEKQVELVTRMGIKMIRDGGGLPTLEKALTQSQDPAEVVGQFVVQLIAALAENLNDQIALDPRVFLAKDGFLDNILDYIEDQLSLPDEFSDQVEGQVIEMIRALAQGESKPDPAAQQPQQPGVEQAPAPQEPPPPQAGGLDTMGGM